MVDKANYGIDVRQPIRYDIECSQKQKYQVNDQE